MKSGSYEIILERRIKKIIEENYLKSDFDIPQLVKLVGLNHRTLSRFCAKHFGMPARKVVQKYRIAHAKECLLNSETIESAFRLSTYNTMAGFVKAFANETGESPSQFIKRESSLAESKLPSVKMKLLRMVIKHYHDSEFNVPLFAKIYSTSPRTFCRHCKNVLSVSPAQLIIILRIKKAKKLLIKGEDIASIPRKLGYKTERAFTVAFEKATGSKPKSFAQESVPMKTQVLLDSIHAYLGSAIDLHSESDIKNALREKLNIALPQRSTLGESLSSTASEHEIIDLLKDHLSSSSKPGS